jgi:hypothetical protein
MASARYGYYVFLGIAVILVLYLNIYPEPLAPTPEELAACPDLRDARYHGWYISMKDRLWLPLSDEEEARKQKYVSAVNNCRLSLRQNERLKQIDPQQKIMSKFLREYTPPPPVPHGPSVDDTVAWPYVKSNGLMKPQPH